MPVDYFLVTFTLPRQLRPLAQQHPRTVYAALFQCATETLKSFGLNQTGWNAELGMTAVLHTHSRRLDYHPHVHVVVPGGGLDVRRRQWRKLRGRYLFNEFNLATVFRAKLLAALRAQSLTLPDQVPVKWVVDCEHVGQGLTALQYLSRYLYRGVIAEHKILSDDGESVTFAYTDSQTGRSETRTLAGETFLFLLMQHVLPKGFRRARDYGFLHGNAKRLLTLVQWVLRVPVFTGMPPPRPTLVCRRCQHPMGLVATLRPRPG